MLVAQITDIHLGFEPDSPREFNRQRLDATLAALTALTPLPDLRLATGDLLDRCRVGSCRPRREAGPGADPDPQSRPSGDAGAGFG